MKLTVHQLVNEFQSREFPITLVSADNRRKEQNMVKQTIEAEDFPGGGGSKYETSITKEFAMDVSRDIILAYMQNEERLTPDHGLPIWMIIPGVDQWENGEMVDENYRYNPII
ncbi:nitrate reductase [NADH]-like [Hibiscus syriacus]|uniref:nitrate reductase [NADH]-like n=1 Tax=Hibiscus syriacus TaxID=106335 RepID=UPI001921D640|nr:nitrate reductase [NADH]-like [Hibiscus syriacus]